jgi:tight adherence protein B
MRSSRLARAAEDSVPMSATLTLAAAALAAGLDVLGALEAVGNAVRDGSGSELARIAGSIRDGAPWADAWADASPRWAPLEKALRPSWLAGAAPGPPLAAAARAVAGRARREGDTAMEEMSVALALPLTLCLLPAFVLVGIVPMVIAVAMGAGVSVG